MIKSKIKNSEFISTKKVLTYSIFTFIFIGTSFLTVFFMYNHFDNASSSSFFTFKLNSPSILLYLGLLLFFYYLFDALRFFYILKTLHIDISLLYLVKVDFINNFLSNITPFSTGGAFTQLYYLSKKDVSIGDATAIATIKSILPVIFFFITTPIVLVTDINLLGIFKKGNTLVSISVLIFVYIIIGYLAYKLLENTKLIKKFLYNILYFLEHKNLISKNKVKKIRRKTFTEIDKFVLDIKRFCTGEKQHIILSFIFMVLYLFTLFLFPVILLKGFHYKVSLIKIIPIQIVLTFATYFAPTPGATGVAEGGFTMIFSNYVNEHDIVPITFWWRFFTTYLGMIIGLVFFYIEIAKRRFKHIKLGSAP